MGHIPGATRIMAGEDMLTIHVENVLVVARLKQGGKDSAVVVITPNQIHVLAIDSVTKLFGDGKAVIPWSPTEVADNDQRIVWTNNSICAVENGIRHPIGRFLRYTQFPGRNHSTVCH